MTKALISTEITAVKLFEENGLDPVLDEIKKKIKEFKADHTTPAGCKEIRSFCYKIARSKTFIDDKGIELVSDRKDVIKKIDAERKRARDFLDSEKARIMKPVTDYEAEVKARLEAERLEEERQAEWDDAIKENDLIDRQRELDRKENELAKLEEERQAKEKAEEDEKARVELEAKMKADAEEKAQKDAEDKIKFEREEKERVEREAKEAAEQAERDKIAAEERAKIEKEIAIKKAINDAEAKAKAEKDAEERRIAEENRIKERKSEDTKHRTHVNNKIKDALIKCSCIDEETAKKIIIATAKCEIEFLKILY